MHELIYHQNNSFSLQMPCEAENPNVPVVLGLAYDPDMHSCNWPDLLIDRGCDPSERLGGFKCPSLRGQIVLIKRS